MLINTSCSLLLSVRWIPGTHLTKSETGRAEILLKNRKKFQSQIHIRILVQGFLSSLNLELNYSNAKAANTDRPYSSYSFYSGKIDFSFQVI